MRIHLVSICLAIVVQFHRIVAPPTIEIDRPRPFILRNQGLMALLQCWLFLGVMMHLRFQFTHFQRGCSPSYCRHLWREQTPLMALRHSSCSTCSGWQHSASSPTDSIAQTLAGNRSRILIERPLAVLFSTSLGGCLPVPITDPVLALLFLPLSSLFVAV